MANQFYREKSVIERFEEFYIPEPNSGCWLWLGGKKGKYGRFKVDGEDLLAHIFSYYFYNGSIPVGLNICHLCDVYICVNPRHLIAETQSYNIQSMYDKGRRFAKGEKNGNAKLTECDVLKIRVDKRSNYTIGECYGISEGLVRFIKNRQRWGHI